VPPAYAPLEAGLKRSAASDDSFSNKVHSPKLFRASALSAADRLPLVSTVLNRALGLLARGDDVSVGDLSVVIEEDVIITGSVLSIANSAAFSRNSRVSSVRRAIAQIGIHKTRNVLLGLTISRWGNAVRVPGPWSSARFNAHALAVATLSDLIVQSVESKSSEWAFVAGLLHDIGLPLIAVGLPEQFRAIASEASTDLQIVEWEREMLGFTHFDLGAEMLARWNCPPVVQEATRFCERAEFPYDPPLNLGAAVKTASLLADANGISMFDASEDDGVTAALLESLQIPAPMEFIAKFKMEYSGMQACAAA
jgi:putative nucleotidyltransferase with HDIG domain